VETIMTEHTSPSSDDDALSALIDGALPSGEADALRARIARDPKLAARLAAMERANRAVRDAYSDVVDEPLPERVLELLRAAQASERDVVDLAARRQRRALPAWLPLAAAASVALAIGLGLGLTLSQAPDTPGGLLATTGPVAQGSALHELLESTPSGAPREVDGATAEVRFTFRAQGREWCRELAVSSGASRNAAVACRRDGAWHVDLVGVEAAGGEVYRPAAGDAPLREAVDALIDGEPLERDAERALVERGWTRD
jgi:negative regulator of sigma E activity